MSAYCTPQQAVARGATPDPTTLLAAIADAGARVDAYTGTWFDHRTATLEVEAEDGQSVVILPAPAVTATALAARAPDVVVPPGLWRVVGDRLYLPSASASSILVLGAEPWAGGYAHLLGGTPRVLELTGTFGPPTVPGPVAEATALLTAHLAPAPTATPTTDAEGNPVGLPENADPTAGPDAERVGPWGTDRGNAGRQQSTTGLAEVDRLLAPWRSRYAARLRVG